MLEPPFNKVAGLKPATLLKRFWHRCFSANFAKFLRATFTEHIREAASETSANKAAMMLKLMNRDISNVRQPHIFPLGKIYWEKILRKVDIDIINWEKFFDRSADHKQCNIPWLVNFKEVKESKLCKKSKIYIQS